MPSKLAKKTIKKTRAIQDTLGDFQDSVVARAAVLHLGVRAGTTANEIGFTYEVVLPDEVDDGHIEATVGDGVLHLRVPKRTTSEMRRRIEVKFRRPLGPIAYVAPPCGQIGTGDKRAGDGRAGRRYQRGG